MSLDGYFLHRIEHWAIISANFGVSVVFHRSALLCQTTLLRLCWYLFLSKHFGPKCHWFKCYITMPNNTYRYVIAPFLLDEGLWPQVLYSKVGGMVPGRLSRPITMSFLFLPNGSFSPKYHLYDSILLSRIVFISTEQGPSINWDFGPRRRPQFKNK